MPTTASQRARVLLRDRYACQCQGQYGCTHHLLETGCSESSTLRLLGAILAGRSSLDSRADRLLEIDHIKPEWAGGSDDDANLQTLCETCHRAKTAQEAFRKSFLQGDSVCSLLPLSSLPADSDR